MAGWLDGPLCLSVYLSLFLSLYLGHLEVYLGHLEVAHGGCELRSEMLRMQMTSGKSDGDRDRDRDNKDKTGRANLGSTRTRLTRRWGRHAEPRARHLRAPLVLGRRTRS